MPSYGIADRAIAPGRFEKPASFRKPATATFPANEAQQRIKSQETNGFKRKRIKTRFSGCEKDSTEKPITTCITNCGSDQH